MITNVKLHYNLGRAMHTKGESVHIMFMRERLTAQIERVWDTTDFNFFFHSTNICPHNFAQTVPKEKNSRSLVWLEAYMMTGSTWESWRLEVRVHVNSNLCIDSDKTLSIWVTNRYSVQKLMTFIEHGQMLGTGSIITANVYWSRDPGSANPFICIISFNYHSCPNSQWL